MTARLLGIARHAMPRGPMEVLDHVRVTPETGLAGDFRGAMKPGRNRRQVSLMEHESWQAALADLARDGRSTADLDWWQRRANLLVGGVRLPREAGGKVRIGAGVLIAVTMECDPCSRMEEIRPGLKAALTPDWRGGVLGIVLEGGEIALGDEIRIEE